MPRHAPRRLAGPACALGLVLLLVAAGAPDARAEENRFNLHVYGGVLVNALQPYENDPVRTADTVQRAGGHVRAGFEYSFAEWMGLELAYGANLLVQRLQAPLRGQQQIVLGVRFRPFRSPLGGYALQRPPDYKFKSNDLVSDVWIDVHGGVAPDGGKIRAMYDVGAGLRIPLVSPIQVGVFIRFFHLIGLDDTLQDLPFLQVVAGVTASFGLLPVRLERDGDGDGIPDVRDTCPKTRKGVEINDLGCEVRVNTPAPRCSDTDLDGVCDGSDRCPGTPLGTPVEANGCAAGQDPSEE